MKMFKKALPGILLALYSVQLLAAHPCDFGAVRSEHVRGNFHVIHGTGGTIGVLAGSDGVFLIDDQVADITQEILAAVREIDDGPIRIVVNTHVHGDHVGGNASMAGEGAILMAHDRVRSRMVENDKETDALPVITYSDNATVHLNGEEMRIMHVSNAHTDGDSIIFFTNSNIVHMGDVLFNNCYPFIDTGRGGSAAGTLGAVEMVLTKIDDETIVISGHGKVTDKQGLAAYHAALSDMVDAILALKTEGKTLEQTLAANPTAAYEESWTWSYGNAKGFVTSVYNASEIQD
jgi:glyoxylase-like metal-dependent hydrolase (beta-lactamase superfamily II)